MDNKKWTTQKLLLLWDTEMQSAYEIFNPRHYHHQKHGIYIKNIWNNNKMKIYCYNYVTIFKNLDRYTERKNRIWIL